MRVLMVTNKVKTYALGFRNIIDPLRQLGHDIIWAADFSKYVGDKNEIPCKLEQININTNPFNPHNAAAYKQLLSIIDKYDIQAIQCSTPIGGALARLAANRRKIKPVIYAAHGFLFFKGAPLINQTVFKLEEIILAHYTDVLITITEEDYKAAQKLKLRSGSKPFLVHGAGVKVGVKVEVDREEKRKSLGIPQEAFVIVSAGELNKNKNTKIIVKALKKMNNSDVHYIACGVGPEERNLQKLADRLGVSDRFHLLGYRIDMPEIMAVSDVFTMMSFREGMPRSLLEAMDLGLPCVGSDTRGIRDLIDQEGGFICDPKKETEFAEAFTELLRKPDLRKKMGEHNRLKVGDYSDAVVRNELTDIYKSSLQS